MCYYNNILPYYCNFELPGDKRPTKLAQTQPNPERCP